MTGLILALDVGKSVGWAVYDPASEIAECGTFSLAEAEDIGAMGLRFMRWLEAQIAVETPSTLALERPFGSGATVVLPSILYGIAHMVAHSLAVPRKVYGASTLKKRITGNGRATKAMVMQAVPVFGFLPDTDHAADAAACAVVAAAEIMQRRAEDMPRLRARLTLAARGRAAA